MKICRDLFCTLYIFWSGLGFYPAQGHLGGFQCSRGHDGHVDDRLLTCLIVLNEGAILCKGSFRKDVNTEEIH